VNGDVFHSDPELAAAFEASGGWDNEVLVMQVSSTVHHMRSLFLAVDSLVSDVLGCPALEGS
jgi:hypothetical protein